MKLKRFFQPRSVTCEHVQASLIAYLHAGLSKEESETVSRHLSSCQTCSAELRRTKALEDQLREDSAYFRPSLSPQASRRIQDRLQSAQRRSSVTNQTKRILGVVAGLAAVALLTFVVIQMLFPNLRSPNPANATAPVSGPAPVNTPAPVATTLPVNTPTPIESKQVGQVSTDDENIISFAAFPWQLDDYRALAAEFHKLHPEITVQIGERPMTYDFRQVASAADVTEIISSTPGQGSYYQDLNQFMGSDAAFTRDDFYPGILQACEDGQGQVYGLPISADITGIYYREAAFDAAGLPYPQPGWTWDDFRKAMDTLTGQENGQHVYGFADDSFIEFYGESVLSPQIGALLNQTGGVIDAQQLAKELQWYITAVKVGSLYSGNIYPQRFENGQTGTGEDWSKAWNAAWKDWKTLFETQPPAMWKGSLNQVDWATVNMEFQPNGSTYVSGIADPMVKKSGIGWVPFPISGTEKEGKSPAQATCLVISKESTKARAAWTWLKFVSEHPPIPMKGGSVPARASLAAQSGWWDRIPEKLHPAVLYGLNHAWYGSFYPAALEAVNEALFQTLKDGTDIQTTLKQSSSQIPTAAPTKTAEPMSVERICRPRVFCYKNI